MCVSMCSTLNPVDRQHAVQCSAVQTMTIGQSHKSSINEQLAGNKFQLPLIFGVAFWDDDDGLVARTTTTKS